MTVPPDLEAQILRYHHVEKWRAGTIARQLSVHYDTVMRVLLQAGLSRNGAPLRGSQIEPYLQFIRATLEKFPTLTASRLFAMVRERGYRGGPDHFDMAPFHFQIEALTHHAVWELEAVKTGVFAPPRPVGAMPFTDLAGC